MALVLELSGGAGNTNPDFSLGGVVSGTAIVDAVDNNLYDDVARKDVLLGKTEFRCFYIINTSGTIPVHGAFLQIDEFPVTSLCTVGLDPVGAGDGVTTGVAQIIALEDNVPAGVIFYEAGPDRAGVLSTDLKVPLPTILPGEMIAIWTKRIAEEGDSGAVTLGITATGNEEALPVGPGSEDFHAPDGLNLAGERVAILASIIPFKVGVAKVGFSQVE